MACTLRPPCLLAAFLAVTATSPLAGASRWCPAGLAGDGVAVIAPSPDGSVVLAGVGGRVVRTVDGGRTWEAVLDDVEPNHIAWTTGRSPIAFVTLGCFDPDHACGIARSADGKKWQVTPAVGDVGDLGDVAVDPADPGRVYVAVRRGGDRGSAVLRSDDSGASWQYLGSDGASPLAITAFAFDPFPPHTLWVGTASAGVQMSRDGAATWESVSRGLPGSFPGVLALAFDPRRRGRAYAAVRRDVAAGGVYVTGDGGATWSASRGSLAAESVIDVVVDPRHPRRVYAATETDGVFVSADRGRRWRSRGAPASRLLRDVAIDARTSAVWAATADGAFVLGRTSACRAARRGR